MDDEIPPWLAQQRYREQQRRKHDEHLTAKEQAEAVANEQQRMVLLAQIEGERLLAEERVRAVAQASEQNLLKEQAWAASIQEVAKGWQADSERRLREQQEAQRVWEEQLRGRDTRDIPQWMRLEIWQRDGGACRECQSTEHLQYDHILPWSRGGATSIENLRILCRTCNQKKAAKI